MNSPLKLVLAIFDGFQFIMIKKLCYSENKEKEKYLMKKQRQKYKSIWTNCGYSNRGLCSPSCYSITRKICLKKEETVMFSSWFEKVITNSTYLVTNLSLMQFMLQGVATMADMFAWQKWMHSVTYKHTDTIIIKIHIGNNYFYYLQTA